MSLEWVAPVATAVVGIAGLCATVWIAHQGRQHAERLAGQATDKAHDLAREARSQERIEIAYRRLLEVATTTTSFVTEADIVWVRDAKPPDIDEVAYEVAILLSVYASDRMREAYSSWQESIEKLRDLLEEVPPKKSWYEHKDVADKFKNESVIAENRLRAVNAVARKELI
jgi:cell division septum initiation protein DivIVA